MSDQLGEIPAAALLWDEQLQMREEQRQFREDFEEHRNRVRERHHALGEQLSLVVKAAEKNTHAREDFEDEIKQLHTVMKQWYRTIIDLQKMVVLIAEHLEVDRVVPLEPPLPLRQREHGRAA